MFALAHGGGLWQGVNTRQFPNIDVATRKKNEDDQK